MQGTSVGSTKIWKSNLKTTTNRDIDIWSHHLSFLITCSYILATYKWETYSFELSPRILSFLLILVKDTTQSSCKAVYSLNFSSNAKNSYPQIFHRFSFFPPFALLKEPFFGMRSSFGARKACLLSISQVNRLMRFWLRNNTLLDLLPALQRCPF